MGINTFAYRVSTLRKDGASVNWVPLNPVVTMLESVAISGRGDNRKAAELLIDFMLSVEGQNLIKSFGRTPVKAGVEIPDEQLAKIKPYPIDIPTIYRDGLESFGKELQDDIRHQIATVLDSEGEPTCEGSRFTRPDSFRSCETH